MCKLCEWAQTLDPLQVMQYQDMTPLQQMALRQRILDDAAAVVASNYAQLDQTMAQRQYDPSFARGK